MRKKMCILLVQKMRDNLVNLENTTKKAFSNFIPALSLARPKLADFFVMLQAGKFRADAFRFIRH